MSWAVAKPVIFEGEDELQLMLEFAQLYVRHSRDASAAAYELFPGEDNYGRAWAAIEKWTHDPIVVREVNRLMRDEDIAVLFPSKDEFAKHLWDRSKQVTDPKVELEYLTKFGEAVGYLQKNGTNVAIQNNVVHNVIEVPQRIKAEDRPDAEARWADQQRKLIADARSSRPS